MNQAPLWWALVQQTGRQGSSYVVFLVLSALLEPRDFGVLGMATLWVAMASVFSEIGLGSALIQRRTVRPEHLSTAFFVNLALGVVLCVLGVVLSTPMATLFRTADVRPVVGALSIVFVINAIASIHATIAQREMQFRALAVRDVTGAIVGGIAGIIAALRGSGVWSLVIQVLVGSVVSAAMTWSISMWRPNRHEVSLESLKELWSYSSWMWRFNIFKFLAQNGDKLLVGYLLGPVALGLYAFAYRITIYPVAGLSGAVGSYMFPRFSRIQEELNLVKNEYVFIYRLMLYTVLPLMVVLATWAPDMVPSIFGQKWQGAVGVVQILTVVAIAQSLISPAGQLMKALNRPEWLFGWSVVFTVVVLTSIGIGAVWGLLGVGVGLAAAHAFGFVANMAIAVRLAGVTWRKFGESTMPVVVSLLVLVGVFWLVRPMHADWRWPVGGTAAAASLLAYGLTLVMLDREFIGALLHKRPETEANG